MTKSAVVSTERRYDYEVCRLYRSNDDNCVPDTHLGFCTPDSNCAPNPHPCSFRGLPHYLGMLEGERQGRQSNDGVLVQEDWITSIILLDDRIMDTPHHIPVPACRRWCPDRNSYRVLGSAIEQSRGIETIAQESLCVG